MPPDEEVAAVLKDRFSGRPMGRLIKTIHRALRAARNAAAESPEPPHDDVVPETANQAQEGGPIL